MKRTKSFTLLIVAAFLLLLSIIFALVTYRNSYQKSVATGEELSAVKKQITAIEEGTATGDLDALQEEKTALSDLKLKQEKPYSFSLTFLFLSILLLIKGLTTPSTALAKNLAKPTLPSWPRPDSWLHCVTLALPF